MWFVSYRNSLIQLLCKRNIAIKWILMTYCFTPRSAPPSARFREATLAIDENRDPQLGSVQRRGFGALSPEWGISIQTLPLMAQRSVQKRRQEDCESRWWCMLLRKQCLLDTTRLTHTPTHKDCGSPHKTCTGFTQTGSPYLEGKVDIVSHSWPRSFLQLLLAGKGKIFLSNGFLLDILITCQRNPHTQE